jgi:hypothetical protein
MEFVPDIDRLTQIFLFFVATVALFRFAQEAWHARRELEE